MISKTSGQSIEAFLSATSNNESTYSYALNVFYTASLQGFSALANTCLLYVFFIRKLVRPESRRFIICGKPSYCVMSSLIHYQRGNTFN
jgi:hypothetical protein